ncbi:hypothetical protein K431DRAFT_325045, partial [Polychaeton citri CBS 116435]
MNSVLVCLAWKIKRGRTPIPEALTHSIAVIYSCLLPVCFQLLTLYSLTKAL